MKLNAKRILMMIALLLSLLMIMSLLAIENTARINIRANLSPNQIAKVKRLFDRNDPRRLRTGAMTKAILGQEELDLALNYAINQYAQGAARLKIEQGKAQIQITLPLPSHSFGRFLNLQIELEQANPLPKISAFTVGHLPLPAIIADSLVNLALRRIPLTIDWQQIGSMVKKVQFSTRRMIVTYRWRGDFPAQLGSVLLSQSERDQLLFYQTRLAELTQSDKPTIELTALINPLFQLAVQRSEQANAIQENRAIIRVLAFYVNQKDLGKLMSSTYKRWPKPVWRSVLLQNRDDFTKHYLVSALLAADAGSPLADAVGVYKEIQDSRGGSGFSFNDLAADRAGTQMGERAVASNLEARAIQKVLAIAKEPDIMPETADLPEFMPEAEFNRRYGGLEGNAYQNMMQEIERRIAALAINRK